MNIGYVLGMEYVPERSKYLLNALLFFFDATPNWLLSVWFVYLSKHWEHLALIGAAMTALSLLLLTFVLPDSPKFHYAKRSYEKT